jgi:epoxyqueuosine reductase
VIQAELQASSNAKILNKLALEAGFSLCRISKSGFLEDEAPRLEKWLKEGRNGTMGYMENHFDKRLNPSLLVEGTKSVVSLVFNYYPEKQIFSDQDLKISKYAYGSDYHKVLRKKLKMLLADFQSLVGQVQGRVFVDSAPILEKAWAAKSGAGWIGKHTNLIHPKEGSFFFLCEMLLDLELQEDAPMPDYCGTCTRCIDACPTEAITGPYQLDASKCISYLTIELKSAIPSEFSGKMENWIFGCDICQDVCPWNKKFSTPLQEPSFFPHPDLALFRKEDWLELTQEIFDEVFRTSALKRTGFEGLKRNIRFTTGESN